MRAFLIFVALVGLGAVVGAVVVGVRVFDGTVVERPYEKGLAWDDEQVRHREADLSVSIDGGAFRTGLNHLVVRASRAGEPIADESVGLRLERPGTGEHEKRYRALRQDDGTYGVSAAFAAPGRWVAVVAIERDGFPLEFRHVVHIEGPPVESEGVEPAGAELSCSIDDGPCAATGENGATVTLEILPRPVRTMADLLFKVRYRGDDLPAGESKVLHLDMPGMYMGENRIVLAGKGGGLYEGRGIIVRCPSGSRIWRAAVEGPAVKSVAFTFQVDAP